MKFLFLRPDIGHKQRQLSIVLRMCQAALLFACLSCHQSSTPPSNQPPDETESATENEKEVFSQEIPKGIFSLTPANSPVPPQILDDPRIVGVTLRTLWENVEPSEWRYDWSYLNQEISRAAAKGKKIFLVVISGGIHTPGWVKAKGIPLFSFTNEDPYVPTRDPIVSLPIFWDKTFLNAKKKLIQEMGRHFSKDENIVAVRVSCANAMTDDWNVPHKPLDIENWKRLGYSSEKLMDACKEVIDASMSAFPNQFVALAIGSNGKLDPDPYYVVREIVKYAREKHGLRFFVERNSISAVKPPEPEALTELTELEGWKILYENKPHTAGQMLWFVTNDRTCRMNNKVSPCDALSALRQAVATGFHYGISFMEIYQQDLLNADLKEVIDYAFQLGS